MSSFFLLFFDFFMLFVYNCTQISNRTLLDSNDIINIKIEDINDKLCKIAIEALSIIIIEYQSKNPAENIINISKSKKFSEIINDVLKKMILTAK